MTKIMKLAAFVLLGLFLHTQAFSQSNYGDWDYYKNSFKGDGVNGLWQCCISGQKKVCFENPENYGLGKQYDIGCFMDMCEEGKVLVNGVCVSEEDSIDEGIDEEVECDDGSVFNFLNGQCEFTCEDGTKVTSPADCPTAEKDCKAGQVQYQTCDKNGVNCGTQERTCSSSKWTDWSTCKVL